MEGAIVLWLLFKRVSRKDGGLELPTIGDQEYSHQRQGNPHQQQYQGVYQVGGEGVGAR